MSLRSKKFLLCLLLVGLLVLTGCTQYHKLQKDLPVYSGAEFMKQFKDTANKSKTHELWSVDAPVAKVSEFYQQQLEERKWKKEMVVPSPDGKGVGLAYLKKDKMLIILVLPRTGGKEGVYVDLAVTKAVK